MLSTSRRSALNPANSDGWPTSRHSWCNWLDTAARLGGRELAHRLHQVARALNQRSMAERERVEILEILRPEFRRALDYLAARVHGQPLPLPGPAQAAYRIMLELLEELAWGYGHAVIYNSSSRCTGRLMPLAAERALSYHGERALRLMQTYKRPAAEFWQNVNRIYAAVERAGVDNREVPDAEIRIETSGRQSPRTMYKRIMLFLLVDTEGFDRGEIGRLYRALESWSSLANLTVPRRAPETCLEQFAVGLDHDHGPVPVEQVDSSPSVRILDVSNLLLHIERLRAESDLRVKPVSAHNEISGAGLARLIDSWMPGNHARNRRARCNSEVDAEVKFETIHRRIQSEAPLSPREADDAIEPLEWGMGVLEDVTIEGVADTEMRPRTRVDGVRPGVNWTKEAEEDDQWQAGAGFPGGESAAPAPSDRCARPRWILKDVSASGFCVIWAGGGSCTATVGELVALRVTGNVERHARWCIGLARRIRFLDEDRFEIGVQTLTCNALAADVRRVPDNSNRPMKQPCGPRMPAFLIPGSSHSGSPGTLLLPAHRLRHGDAVELAVGRHTSRFRVGRLVEDTGVVSLRELVRPSRGGRRVHNHTHLPESLQSSLGIRSE